MSRAELILTLVVWGATVIWNPVVSCELCGESDESSPIVCEMRYHLML